MNVYEDKYLREKLNRIIAKQKEGKIVVAAYKDGSGLPAAKIGDVAQENGACRTAAGETGW